MDPFVAEIRIFPFNFAPRGWAFCDGQILPISQNTALFSLLGTTYGGDGQSIFALPNMQGNVPMHPGQGPGLSLHDLGETSGTETVTLMQSELPSHAHGVAVTNNCYSGTANRKSPAGAVPAGEAANVTAIYVDDSNPTGSMGLMAVTGGGLPHNNMQPYLTLNFCIALQGVYPQRS